MNINQIIEEWQKLPEEERNYTILKLLIDNKINFTKIAELYITSLQHKITENKKYEIMGAVALEWFRPNGILKGKHTMKHPENYQGGLDGIKAKALLFIKHANFFKEDYIDKELSKINKKIIEDELNNY